MKLILLIVCVALASIHISSGSKIGPSHYIYGADDAPDVHAPFQCSLQRGSHHYCGCSIISKQYVITAAECLYGRVPGEIEIMVGSNEINGGQYYLVDKIIVHENYDKYTNNIAVAKVKGPIKTNKKVRPIPITRSEIPDGRQIEITGWGKLGMALPHPTHLQLSEVKAASTAECQKRLPFADESNFCSFHKDHEFTCQGDQGNPVVIRGEGENYPQLVGIVINPFCGQVERPNMFAKISHLYSWIKSQTDA